METALYLLPVTLGDTSVEKVLPVYNKEIISGIKYFIVEDVRSARRFLKKVDHSIVIDDLTFFTLNKHTSPEDISGFLKPLAEGNSMGYFRLWHQDLTVRVLRFMDICLLMPMRGLKGLKNLKTEYIRKIRHNCLSKLHTGTIR